MPDPERSDEPRRPREPSEHERPTPRGFGEFSGAYRARWALSHPDMNRQWPADQNSEPRPSALPDAEGATEPGAATVRVESPRRYT